MSRFTDYDGKPINAGDTISFSYGIPPVKAFGSVAELNGALWVYTPGHNPDRCKLKELIDHVQAVWKEKPRRSIDFSIKTDRPTHNQGQEG